jgi:hypothetical protein
MKKLLLTAFLLGFCLVTTPAMADPISDWEYTLIYGFQDGSWSPASATGSLLNPYGDPTRLEWGTGGSGPSSIQASGMNLPTPPNGITTGTYSLGDGKHQVLTFTHENNPIYSTTPSSSLTETTLYSTFSLGPFFDLRSFEIEFWETPNSGYPTNPADPDWVSDDYDENNPAEDYFWLRNPEDLITEITYLGYIYTITFEIEGLVELPNKALAHWADEGITEGALGLITQEDRDTSFISSFTMTARAVPEPGTMILFGIGMIGLAGAMRRKKM